MLALYMTAFIVLLYDKTLASLSAVAIGAITVFTHKAK